MVKLFSGSALRGSVLGSVLAVAVVYLATLAVAGDRGFWITDNQNKFLQMEAIVESGYSDYSIPWNGAQFDPGLGLNPLPLPFTQVIEGRLYSQYPPLFAVVSSVPYRLFGFRGLYLLPLAGALLTLVGVGRLAGALGLERRWRQAAVLLVGLCTPLWFYSVVFWEHTLALGLLVWAVGLLLRFASDRSKGLLIAGGAAAAGAAYFRDETVLFCAALVAFVFVVARGERVRATAVLIATMVLVFGNLVPLRWAASFGACSGTGPPVTISRTPSFSMTSSVPSVP